MTEPGVEYIVQWQYTDGWWKEFAVCRHVETAMAEARMASKHRPARVVKRTLTEEILELGE